MSDVLSSVSSNLSNNIASNINASNIAGNINEVVSSSIADFFSSAYMPHGHCYYWQPGILWTNVISDFLIAVAYFSIPTGIAVFLRNRNYVEYRGLLLLFAAFIFLCGITHLFSIYTIWHGAYGTHGILKGATALVSMLTAVVLIKNMPALLSLPTQEEMQRALRQAASEKLERDKLELEKRAEAIFKFSLELLPTGLLVIDGNRKIRIANRAIEVMFGYEQDELKGKDIAVLLSDKHAKHHDVLVGEYMANPSQGHAMASGRVVRGRAKDGKQVFIEISLSVHEFDGEKHAFASVVNVNEVISEKNLQLESSNRIKRAVEATNDGLWEWNAQTNDVWYSARFQSMIGHDEEVDTTIISFWLDHIHPNDRAAVNDALRKHLEQKNKFDVVYLGKTKEGYYEWMNARGDTIFDDQGSPLLMSGTLTNVHSMKLLEMELSEKTKFLNAVLDKSLCGTYIYNLEKQANTFVNEQYTAITGYTLDDLKALRESGRLKSLIHKDDLKNMRRHIQLVINNQDRLGVPLEYRIKHKHGQWIWCYSRDAVYSLNEEGKVKEILGTFFDISALKSREEEIKSLALDFVATFEQAAVGIAHLALDGTWLKGNEKLCNILGYRYEELIAKNIQDVTYPEDLDKEQQDVDALLTGLINQYAMEKRFVRSNGSIVWTLFTVSLVKDSSGAPEHFIVVVEDISERKRIESSLAESNASLERFAYSASHDMQEPLRKISAFTDSLEQRLIGKLNDPEARYELNRISDAAIRMREMIDSLLKLSRLAREKIRKERVEFSRIMTIVVDDLSELIADTQAQVNYEGNEQFSADLAGVQQVLRNLIANSIRYARPNVSPVVNLRCWREAHRVMIEVTDNGRGFDEKYAEQIFEPFRRLVGRDIPGSGMGLALCRQIVSAHNGTITVRSTPNHGAVFMINLPQGSY